MVSICAYGLEILGLPEAFPYSSVVGDSRLALEWTMSPGEVATQPAVWTQEGSDRLLVGWGDYAEYDLRMDRGLVNVRLGAISETEAAIAFVLSVVPLAVPLLGLEPLHCSSVLLPNGKALLVLGDSEAGKSTTAAQLRRLGCVFLADDVGAVDEQGNVWPGPPLLASRAGPEGGPIVADYDDIYELCTDGRWRFAERVITWIFVREGASSPLQLGGREGRR